MIAILRHAPMALLWWLAALPTLIVGKLLVWVLAPALALYSVLAGRRKLPGFLAWAHTVDKEGYFLDAGQKDNGWERGVTGVRLWWQRTYWMWRNPFSGFGQLVLGRDPGALSWAEGDPTGPWDRGVGRFVAIRRDARGRRFFTYRRDFKMPGRRWAKVWLGWGINPGASGRYEYRFELHPWRKL